MAHWVIIIIVFGAVVVAGIGQGWSQYLEHRKRALILEAIKEAYRAGREPDQRLFDQLSDAERYEREGGPWRNVIVFGALALAFGAAAYFNQEGPRHAFVVVAIAMGATALGSAALAVASRRDAKK